MLPSDIAKNVRAADRRLEGHVRRTPVERSSWLSEAGDCNAHLKLENLQATGSFKLRGALNKLLSMSEADRGRGVVAASTGNHGAGVARGAAMLGCDAVIFAPTIANEGKLAAVRGYGAEVRSIGADCVESEAAARAYATAADMAYISPYNDPAVMAGQGTIGCELSRQLATENLAAVFVAVGGGGLIGGIGSYLKSVAPDVKIIGASPRNSAVMHASLEAGRILDLESEPTLSDGTAGGIEADSITFPICQKVIDEFVLVSEQEIRAALRGVIAHEHTLIEGAAGVAVAAFQKQGARFAGRDVAIVLCGANIDPDTLKEIL